MASSFCCWLSSCLFSQGCILENKAILPKAKSQPLAECNSSNNVNSRHSRKEKYEKSQTQRFQAPNSPTHKDDAAKKNQVFKETFWSRKIVIAFTHDRHYI